MNSDYHRVRPFHLNGDCHLFFDIFARNNELIMICPVYANTEEIEYNAIQVRVSGAVYTNCTAYPFVEYEPIVIISFQLESCQDILNVVVDYKGITHSYTLPHISLAKTYSLVSTCLFLNDYRWAIPSQLYYASQGVEHFFYYFNHSTTEPIRELSNEKTTLIPWGFRYMRWDKYYVHHAQLGQLNHALYKYGKPLSKYLINHDLDEYMHIRGQSLSKLIQSDNPVYIFRNYWCRVIKPPTHMPPTQFLRAVKTNGVDRTKYICKTDVTTALGVHHPKQYTVKEETDEEPLQLLHFKGINKGYAVTEFPYELYTMPH